MASGKYIIYTIYTFLRNTEYIEFSAIVITEFIKNQKYSRSDMLFDLFLLIYS